MFAAFAEASSSRLTAASGNLDVGVTEARSGQADSTEHAVRLETDRTGDLEVIYQARTPDDMRHDLTSASVPKCKQTCPGRSIEP